MRAEFVTQIQLLVFPIFEKNNISDNNNKFISMNVEKLYSLNLHSLGEQRRSRNHLLISSSGIPSMTQ